MSEVCNAVWFRDANPHAVVEQLRQGFESFRRQSVEDLLVVALDRFRNADRASSGPILLKLRASTLDRFGRQLFDDDVGGLEIGSLRPVRGRSRDGGIGGASDVALEMVRVHQGDRTEHQQSVRHPRLLFFCRIRSRTR